MFFPFHRNSDQDSQFLVIGISTFLRTFVPGCNAGRSSGRHISRSACQQKEQILNERLNKTNGQRQQGAALILALLVVVVVTLLASTLASDFLVAFRRVENQLLSKQAYAYLRGAEGLARNVLQSDYQLSKDKDHISEGWLNVSQDFPLDQGVISATLCDLQGRFNINSLVSGSQGSGSLNTGSSNGTSSSSDYSLEQKMFIRLLQTLNLGDENSLDQHQSEQITNAVSDWIDGDNRVSANGGAEDDYYNGLDLPYRTGNRELLSVSELRWVKGIDGKILAALEPYVAALPRDTALNINSANVKLIQSINAPDTLQPLNENDALAIIEERDGEFGTINGSGNTLGVISGTVNANQFAVLDSSNANKRAPQGFDQVSDFSSIHPINTIDVSRFSVVSDYFLLDATTVFMDRKFRLFSVLYRNPENGNIKTLARANTGLGKCSARLLY